MRQGHNACEAERGLRRQLSSRASSATLRLPQQRPFNFSDGRHEKTDVSIAQGLLREEALNHPRRRSPFDASPVTYNRQSLSAADGQSDGVEASINQERGRKDRNTSNTWTDSSLNTEVDDEENRTNFVNEYNRLAEKHGVRKLVPEGYESVDVDTVTVTGKQGSWIMRKLLRRTSSMQTLKVKTDKQIRHKRSISDFSTRLRIRKEPLKDKTLKELVDICGRSLLYLPSEYAAGSLSLPTCLRATAHHIVQHGITTRGIFRIPGSNSSILTLYNYYATVDDCPDAICGTVRAPILPEHLNYEVHDVASVFKKFLSGLPGGILQGSTNIFEALIAIQSHLNSDPEWTRTKQSKVRARLIALAIGSVRSRLQRELMCAVFGLLCMIGRAAEIAPREDDRGRPLPTSGLMGYGALGITFGPLLLGEVLDSYEMRFAPGGAIVFPVAPSVPPPKESGKTSTYKRRSIDEFSYAASRFDKVKVANGIAEMLITHWRDVVRHMRGLGILKTNMDRDHGLDKTRRSQLRPYASELFTLRKPPEWSAEESCIRRVQRTPSPVTPLQRHISQSEPGPISKYHESLHIRKQRSRPMPPSIPILSGSKSMGTLSPMVEEPTIEDEGEKIPSENPLFQPLQISRPPFFNRLPSNPALREAVEQLKSPPMKEKSVVAMTETSHLLAEVARELRMDAQKRIGANPGTRAFTASVAELPSQPDIDVAHRLMSSTKIDKPDHESPMVDPPSRLEEATLEEPNQTSPPQPSEQIPGESIKKDVNLGEDTLLKGVTENVNRVRLVQKSSPRSNAQSFFEKVDQDSTISSTTGRFQDQITLASSGRMALSPKINAVNKIEEQVPQGAIEMPLAPAEEQAKVIAVVKTSSKSPARQYFERADNERTSASTGREKREAFMSDNANVVPSHSSTSPGIREEMGSKNYSPIRSHAARSESPLRSEVRRPSTPKKYEDIELGSVAHMPVESSSQVAHTPLIEIAKYTEKVPRTPSPPLMYENKDLVRTSESQQPPERPEVPLRRPKSLVASRIRGLLTSDPSNQKTQNSVLRVAPNTSQTPLVVEWRKSDKGGNSPTVLAKEVLERVSQEEGLTSLSTRADPARLEAQDYRQIRTTDYPDYKPAEGPLDLDMIQTFAASPAHPTEGLFSIHEIGQPDIEDRVLEGAEKGDCETSNQNIKRGSDCQRSDASNITVKVSPKNMGPISGKPTNVSRQSSSEGSEKTIISSPKLVDQIQRERPTLEYAESGSGIDNAFSSDAAPSLRQTEGQAPFFETPQHLGKSTDVAKTPDKRPPLRAVRGSAGTVMALAAKFNNTKQTSPEDSPVKRAKPRGIIRHSLFQPVDRLVSNYTTNSPSPAKTTQSERSDIRTMRNPLPLDRRPDAQSRVTPQKEISPLYRTSRNGGVKDPGSPSPFSFSKTPPVPLKRRSAFDGNDSFISPTDARSPSARFLHNQSPSIRESLGSRTSSVGTVLPRPIEPPVDQHVSFIRPTSTPRRPAHDQEIFRVMTPSGNAALYEQIRKLQKQLGAAAEELAQYKRQMESRGNLQELGTLSEQLRESKREARSWKARAELAERRLAVLVGIKGKTEHEPGDGTRDDEDKFNSEASVIAVFNENKSRNGHEGKSRVLGEATDYATQSTDTEVWVRGGIATIVRGSEIGRDSSLIESRDHNGEQKMVIHDVAVGILPSMIGNGTTRLMGSSSKISRRIGMNMGGDGVLSSWNFDAKEEETDRVRAKCEPEWRLAREIHTLE